LSSCADLLASLNPLSLTFNLASPDRPLKFHDWVLDTLDWKACMHGWTRLREVTLLRGSLIDDKWSDDEGLHTFPILHRQPDERPLGNGSVPITYDVRGMDLEGMEKSEWPESIHRKGVLELAPRSKIIIKASTDEVAAWIDLKLRKEDFAARDRVEIEVEETDTGEGEAVRMEIEYWRRRGRDWVEGRMLSRST
jgi:hypothetical protein